MTEYRAPLDDMNFISQEVFINSELWERLSLGEVVEQDTATTILQEAAKLMAEVVHPLNRVGDQQGCHWSKEEGSEGQVRTPAGFKEAYQAFIEGGWNSLLGEPEYGGMGVPLTLACHVQEMLQGANISFGLAPMLTAGACLAILTHGTEEIKQTYLPKLYEGVWSGAMDLTESHAGSDLSIIRSKASPNADGSYSVTGTKIFITWGEHDMAENIIHLVLAKLPDAPEGSKGISMFLVPKFLVNDDGSLGERNRVNCGSIEHKMGIHGSATCVMNYDGATAWLVGEPNKGLAAMFTMMNDERLAVGIQALGVSELAYQLASNYAKDRTQGRNPAGAEQADKVADCLLAHADVRRMLLSVRAFNEAGRAFLSYVARWLDIEKFSKDQQEQERAAKLVALLTPIAKAFISDKSFDNTVLAQQVLGGHGYISEWGLEQLVRDARITQIYEGTNGIQAMDLLGRKTVASQGKLLDILLEEINNDLQAENPAAQPYKEALIALIPKVKAITDELVSQAASDAHRIGSSANNYLHLLGYLSYLYMWFKMASSCGDKTEDFYRVKRVSGNFFLQYLLPQTEALLLSLQAETSAITELKHDDF